MRDACCGISGETRYSSFWRRMRELSVTLFEEPRISATRCLLIEEDFRAIFVDFTLVFPDSRIFLVFISSER